MTANAFDFAIDRLGECRIPSPMVGAKFVGDADTLVYHSRFADIQRYFAEGQTLPSFELAGPRERIYFDPSKLKCGIVTCGGLCPGINDVIRAIVLGLRFHYGVSHVFGFPFGYEGLAPACGHEPIDLTPQRVEDIHQKGGTILGSSRGPQDVAEMVDTLERMNVGVLFTIGGDGTLRGAGAIAGEIRRRGLKIGIIGVPKTIDNDIAFVQQSFGFVTAVTETRRSIYTAHIEAVGARNGIGLVKLMGRHSGFIAAMATLANSDVNFCLIPEVPFSINGILEELRRRLQERSHAVVVVGEGAGQDLMSLSGERDASGNLRLGDIGLFLRDQINAYFKKQDIDVTLKYIDPSYTIRSMPANAHDSAFCLLLGHHAVHAAMAGKTNMVIGFWKNEYTHLPIQQTVSCSKEIDPDSRLWHHVLASTGQPWKM